MEIKPSKKNTTLYKIVLCIATVILLLIVWLIFIANNTQPDESIFNFLSYHTTAPRTNAMKVITSFGNHNFLIPANLLVIVFFMFKKSKQDALGVLIIALSSLGLMSLLKNLFHRHRPINPLIEGITNFSFPSGHAFMSVAFFGLLIYFISHRMKARRWKHLLISVLLFIIFLIGFSRVYLRVHYTTDVMAGWFFGVFWLLLCLSVLNKFLNKNPATSQ